MPSIFLTLLALFFSAGACLAQNVAARTTAIPLDEHLKSVLIKSPIQVWNDADASASIETVSKLAASQFRTVNPGTYLETHQTNALWIHLQLQRSERASSKWVLNIPAPQLDLVTLYSRDDQGGWSAQSAGDTIAASQWPSPGLYPQFDLSLPSQTVQDVYLRVSNFKNISAPIRLSPMVHRAQQRENEYTALGLIIGAMLALLVWSLIQFITFRNAVDGWYSLYIVFMSLTVGTLTGLSPALLWPESTHWTNISHGVMPAIGLGLTLLFVRHLALLSTRYFYFDKLLFIFGWSSIASATLFWLPNLSVADGVSYFFFALAPVLGITASALAWRRKNPVGVWLLLAFVPQFLGLMVVVLQRYGVAQAFWEIRYGMAAAIAAGVPLMLHALNIQSRELKTIVGRVRALPTQDALTGLLTAPQFDRQLKHAITRSVEKKELATVVMVDIANYEHLRQAFDEATAEMCLLRAAIKLYRVIRDIDAAGRIGTARFGLVLEGVNSRQELSERMVKLIGSGLTPLAGFKPEVTLQFHVTAVILSERHCDPNTVLDELGELQASMSGRTKRPIRFLEQAVTAPMPLG